MRHISLILLSIFALVLPQAVSAQVRNEGLANGVTAARKKDAAMLQQYNWNCRMEILDNGTVKDLRIYLVNVGPDGLPQKSLLNDQESPLTGGPFRKAIEENKRKQTEEYGRKVAKLVDQYTLASAGKVIDFMAQAQIQPITTPDGKSLLQMTGANVVVPGDSMTMSISGSTLRPTGLQITTTCDGDNVTVSASYTQIPGGPAHMQYANVQIPDKNLSVMIHNYDYVLATPPPPPAPPVAPPVAVGGALPVGTTMPSLPAGFQTLNVNGQTYYQSGPNWFRMEVGANGVYYLVVQAP